MSGVKKQVKLIWKCFSIRAQRFLPFVNIMPGARDMFCRSLGLSAETGDIPIHSYLKNHAQNEHKMIHFLPIFCNKSCFYMFSHVTQWVRPDYNKKRKKCRIRIFAHILCKNWPKYKEIPLFSQKSWYLKITFLNRT